MDRRFFTVFVCHLVFCQSVLSAPNFNESGKSSMARTMSLLSSDRDARIIGGEPADIEKYPFVVSLQKNGTFYGYDVEHICGGNIIGEKWILTAAKCCYGQDPTQFHVRIGSKLYYTGGRIHQIEKIETHPNYNRVTWDYDVGLLKLHEAIVFSEKVQPIDLPKMGASIEIGTDVDIVGWGATQEAYIPGLDITLIGTERTINQTILQLLGMPSATLMRDIIPTISQDDCRLVYSKVAVTDRMFCTLEMGQGACIGDTGSPAVINGVIIGVASWSQSCAYKYPTAYARLPEMVDWIIKVTGDSS